MNKNILIGCECSGVVRDAFRKLGFNAYSCDLKPCETAEHSLLDSPYHLQMDVMKAIKLRQWDLIGLHPDCTAMAVSGNRWYGNGMPMNDKRVESVVWTRELWNTAKSVCPHVYLENPVGVLFSQLDGHLQYVQPWQFGHGETKKTGLMLQGLNPLQPTDIVEGREQRIWKMPPSANRKTERSRTFTGIGDAMADQWGRQI